MKRLDVALVERGLTESREKARRAVMAGRVTINGQLAHKSSETVKATDIVSLESSERYVSRGGIKLEHALQYFSLDARGLRTIDMGASTGGFTDCLLQHGADRVFSVDVGHGQIAWKLRNDPRVVVMDNLNARYLTQNAFPQPFTPVDLIVIDCSFISLQKIIPAAVALLKPSGRIVALIKPQFEAGKAEVDKGAGVISDPALHARIINELRDFIAALPEVMWRGTTESPLLGPAGNKEFFVLIEKAG